jgi:hypothetical protein
MESLRNQKRLREIHEVLRTVPHISSNLITMSAKLKATILSYKSAAFKSPINYLRPPNLISQE